EYEPKAIVPTPVRSGRNSPPDGNCMSPVVLTCRTQGPEATDEHGKAVRAPPVPSTKLAAPPWGWPRIFCEMGVIDCVVNRLAAAMSLGFAPPAFSSGGGSRSAFVYPLFS